MVSITGLTIKRGLPPVPSSTENVRQPTVIKVYVDAFLGIASLPFWKMQQFYQRSFRACQETIAKAFGFSRRFSSLVSCLAPQLDHETFVLFKRTMHNLWMHETWMNRKVSFEEAQHALSQAHACVKDQTYNHLFWEMRDFGPEISRWTWDDLEGNRIASASVYTDGANPDSGKTQVEVWVFRSLFIGEQANALIACYKSKI